MNLELAHVTHSYSNKSASMNQIGIHQYDQWVCYDRDITPPMMVQYTTKMVLSRSISYILSRHRIDLKTHLQKKEWLLLADYHTSLSPEGLLDFQLMMEATH